MDSSKPIKVLRAMQNVLPDIVFPFTVVVTGAQYLFLSQNVYVKHILPQSSGPDVEDWISFAMKCFALLFLGMFALLIQGGVIWSYKRCRKVKKN